MAVSIAIIGFNGILGKPVYEALTSDAFRSKVKEIKVVSRSDPKQPLPGVEYVIGDVSNESEVTKLAQGVGSVDAVISLVGLNPAVNPGLEAFLAQVKPQLYIPSDFSGDIEQTEKLVPGSVGFQAIHSETVRQLGIKVADVYTGLFHEPGTLPENFAQYFGISPDGSTVVRGDVSTETSVTSVRDVGRVLAAIATFPDYSKLLDFINVESDKVSYTDVHQAWSAFHGKPINITRTVTKEEALAEVKNDMATNGFDHAKLAFYLHSLTSQGAPGGLVFAETHNDLINPGTWEWEKFQRA
ncbi:hypothetical protein DIURU_001489 [Diutina rugosa]|uniref:NmrA-like domain-containing protein n=1 Tax=Diutina rugosa TaxID=5481 RepID=A0A642UUD9_DIURU|nr:uncharacterized protein DIURU_001489 [Diutina rugosa]KAA8905416.1 hypothetical protein DIURU_001489 [Diutina rugosa]